MRPFALILRSLTFAWRTHVAVALSVAVGTAALTGALLVGDSMRGSLRDHALKKLGPVDYALSSPQFFTKQLADDLSSDASKSGSIEGAAGLVVIAAGVENATTNSRVNDATLYGIDDTLRNVFDDAPTDATREGVAINRELAQAIGINEGDDVLLRISANGPISAESMLGRPDEATRSLRLRVAKIVSNDGIGGFTTNTTQSVPRNAFVSLARLQRAIDQADRVNTILVHESVTKGGLPDAQISELTTQIANHATLNAYHLRLRRDEANNAIALETDRLLIDPVVEEAVKQWSQSHPDGATSGVLTYLANEISIVDSDGDISTSRSIPYSIVSGLDPTRHLRVVDADTSGSAADALQPDEIILNQWAASDLSATVGDRVALKYYVSEPFGGMHEESHTFRVARIVPIEGWAADRGLMPPYPGIADATSLGDWDPPPAYKIDMRRIRKKDEAYWEAYRGTPKAFVNLTTAQALWAGQGRRFGDLTAIYFAGRDVTGKSAEDRVKSLESSLLKMLSPNQMGLRFTAVKRDALAAGAGSTDFSGLFIAFSFFVIIAALVLVALSFRLATERRATQVGLLLAIGISRKRVARLLIAEGAIVATVGAAIGVPVGIGYGWLMLTGLTTWWAAAVNATFLTLHATPLSLVIGFIGGFVIAVISIALSLRGVMHMSPRSLLAGWRVDLQDHNARHRRIAPVVLVVSLVIAVATGGASFATDAIPMAAAFFVVGGALLFTGLAAFSVWLTGTSGHPIDRAGATTIIRLGMRNARRARGRSRLTTALIAFATFVIVAVGASRHDAGTDALAKSGGTGGFDLIATPTTPIPFDLNTPAGRDRLSLSDETKKILDGADQSNASDGNVELFALRRKPGDDSSCLNLYQVRQPEILGAPESMIARGGFSFAQSAANSDDERENPWRLLDHPYDDGAIPAIGDMNTLMWLLKLGIGDDLTITDERGRERKLRIVGMLSGSVLQSQLIVAESRFLDLFPSVTGYTKLLIDVPDDRAAALSKSLERDLTDYALDVESTIDVLNRYRAVENTYMSAFQALGGLGLIMGTIGLGAVMLRNVLERMGELALLRALGYSRRMLAAMVMSENALLLLTGLSIGTVSALIAAAPNALATCARVAWGSLSITLLAVVVIGWLAGLAATRAASKVPLVGALRSE